ncbi:MAG: LD-carboxypeptidase [Parasporobacterium sp.]|nr:LD-carboxypeptidase [Parasporobacterium sp.]
MKKVGIVACSDAQKEEYRKQNEELIRFLESNGIQPVMSSCIYEKHDSVFSGSPKEKASQLMRMFAKPDIEEIYDISGGDMANQILDDLDYEIIAESKAVFWGYSDLTTVINAIYTMTGKASVLYQVKFMTSFGTSAELQRERFQNRDELFSPTFEFVQKDVMSGIVVGGNIRCFLKLAGTRYFPALENKILLLEALGGEVPQMATYLASLKQIGAFEKVNGIILGTFTTMEKNHCVPDIITLIKEYAHPETPIAVTKEIGHGDNAKAIFIGKEIEISV